MNSRWMSTILTLALLTLKACSNDGGDIDRPDDQAFDGGDTRNPSAPALNHRFTTVRLQGTTDTATTVSINDKEDQDSDPEAFAADFDFDGEDLPVDPIGSGDGEVYLFEILATDTLTNETRTGVELILDP